MAKKKRKHRCSQCGNQAVWLYMPNGNFYCAEHVPRGCTCNVCDIEFDGEPKSDSNLLWWSKNDYEENMYQNNLDNFATKERQVDSFYYEYLDEKGRREPCCEFEYDEDGFEIEETQYYLDRRDIIEVLESHKLKYLISSTYAEKIKDILKFVDDRITYNDFMTKLGDISFQFFKLGYHSSINIKFYRSIKYKLRERRYIINYNF